MTTWTQLIVNIDLSGCNKWCKQWFEHTVPENSLSSACSRSSLKQCNVLVKPYRLALCIITLPACRAVARIFIQRGIPLPSPPALPSPLPIPSLVVQLRGEISAPSCMHEGALIWLQSVDHPVMLSAICQRQLQLLLHHDRTLSMAALIQYNTLQYNNILIPNDKHK